MTVSRTPQKIDATVSSFCSMVNPNSQPIFLEVTPHPQSQPLACFENVKSLASAEGGKIIYGWAIWYWPQVYIEAEHHAVWQTKDGQLIDVTPNPINESKLLFVADKNATYDFQDHKRRDNIRRAISKSPEVAQFLDHGRHRYEVFEKNSEGLVVTLPQNILRELEEKHYSLLYQLFEKFLKPNDPCPCGSGKKNKRCHRINMA